MKTIMNFMERYFVPVAGRIGAQRHLVAIRDGFVSIMPLIIAGSMAVLINSLPIEAYQSFMTNVFGESWKSFGGNVWTGSFAIMSLLVMFTIASSLAKHYKKDPLAAGVVSFGSLMAVLQGANGGIPYEWAAAKGLFVAIIVALLSTEIFCRLAGNDKLIIKMPEMVPPAVAKSFAALLPTMITLSIFALIKVFTVKIGIPDIHKAIYDLIQAPLSEVANTLPSAILIALLNHMFWFFGLHGSNILEPIMQAVYLPALDANITAAAAGEVIPNIVTKPFFDSFVYMGGSGATICLIIAIFAISKRKDYRSIAELSAAPGLFNINESMMYGLPVVLNPILLIPFITVPIVLTVISYLAIASGLVPPTTAMVPWTTPPIISGWMATGGAWQGSLLQIINIGIGISIYLPFIAISERMARKNKTEVEDEIEVA